MRLKTLMLAAGLGLSTGAGAHPGHMQEQADLLGHVHSHSLLETVLGAVLPLALVLAWGLWAWSKRRPED